MPEDVKATYITSPEAARILRITNVGVAQLVRHGKIPAVKIANRWLIPKAFVEEFAKTYEGRRGRPKKKGPPTDILKTWTQPIHPAEAGSTDAGMASVVKDFAPEADSTLAVNAQAEHLKETPSAAIQPAGLASTDTRPAPETAESKLEADATLAMNAKVEHLEETPAAAIQPVGLASADTRPVPETVESKLEPDEILAASAQADHQLEDIPTAMATPGEPGLGDAGAALEAGDSRRETDESFAVSAEIYHLDSNYDFELYEKGEITEGARLIVARLKPKIHSLPQFSFRWDYRYEHLNVDIHGVEPAAVDWFRMGENGYSGHLPRRLGGPDPTYEAVIWRPVTFVFRGRLRLVLQKKSPAAEDLSSPAPASEGHRKWGRFLGPKRAR
jgi:excisionase family DNA binding protein